MKRRQRMPVLFSTGSRKHNFNQQWQRTFPWLIFKDFFFFFLSTASYCRWKTQTSKSWMHRLCRDVYVVEKTKTREPCRRLSEVSAALWWVYSWTWNAILHLITYIGLITTRSWKPHIIWLSAPAVRSQTQNEKLFMCGRWRTECHQTLWLDDRQQPKPFNISNS